MMANGVITGDLADELFEHACALRGLDPDHGLMSPLEYLTVPPDVAVARHDQ